MGGEGPGLGFAELDPAAVDEVRRRLPAIWHRRPIPPPEHVRIMIIFDLKCAPQGHVFEAWFGSSEDYEAQRARGLVACPICGAGEVDKAPMAPNVGAKGNQAEAAARGGEGGARRHGGGAEEDARPARHFVGDKFADEARAIHLGEAEARAIHGQATPQEAEDLRDEGIPVAPLPFPVPPPETEN